MLEQPIDLPCGVTLANRILKSAMSETLGSPTHDPTQGHATLYRRWAQGGLGLSITGNVMVCRDALGEPGNVVLDERSDPAAFRNWATHAATGDCSAWVQLNHPGKQSPAFLSKHPVAPSAIPLGQGLEYAFRTPRALEHQEVLDLVQRFGDAAGQCKQLGFGGVQLHGAHGYLISQFLSPRHNQRSDAWGGTPAKRRAFVLAVYEAVRGAVGPDFPVGIKLNSADFYKDGLQQDEALDAASALDAAGIDLIEISGGTYEAPAMTHRALPPEKQAREAYFVGFAEAARGRVERAALALTGGLRSARAMEGLLADGIVDMVGLARPLCVDPDAPRKLIGGADYVCPSPRPSTGIKALDRVLVLDVTWFEQQLYRMSVGQEPVPRMSAYRSLAGTLTRTGLQAYRMRRA